MTDPAFPDVPQEDVFAGVDIGKFTDAMAEQQRAFIDRTLTDDQIDALGQAVTDFEAASDRRSRILKLVSFYGGLGLRLVSVA